MGSKAVKKVGRYGVNQLGTLVQRSKALTNIPYLIIGFRYDDHKFDSWKAFSPES